MKTYRVAWGRNQYAHLGTETVKASSERDARRQVRQSLDDRYFSHHGMKILYVTEVDADQTLSEGAASELILYHVTPARNVARIMRDGLTPKIGPRSRKLKEPVAGIYLFHSIAEAEDGAANWLGDEFGDETRLALLAVRVPADAKSVEGAGFETILTTAVPPQNIKIVSKDF